MSATASPRTSARIAVRADASATLGSGHVMRCLTLADALRERGATLHFVCRDLPGHLAARIRTQGFGVTLLAADGSVTPDQARDAAQTLSALEGRTWDLAVVDHYALGLPWERTCRAACRRIVAIDDLADRRHEVDLLLDANLGRRSTDYDGLVPNAATRLIGPSFALLRPAFARAREASLARRADGTLRRVLVSMGGADPGGATALVLRALASAPDALPAGASISIVMGAMANTVKTVRAAAAALPWPAEVMVDVEDMTTPLAVADLAIGAAGSSAWERCCLGVPTLLLMLAENQRAGAQALAAAGAARLLDPIDRLPETLPPALQELADPTHLRAMSQASARVTDGHGASRVADTLLDLLEA